MSCIDGPTLSYSQNHRSNYCLIKRNINRDYSDALMMAETIHQFFPKLIELHNYTPTNAIKSKLANWKTLNSIFLDINQIKC
jgi:hypothetical protein